MLATFGALAPVFLMIALGRLLAERGFPGDHFWGAAERLVYWILFPALLVLTTAGSELGGLAVLPVAGALIAAMLTTAGCALALRPWLALDDAGFTSVLQGAIRNNTYVGLAGGAALYGQAGLAIMGFVVFVVVTTANLLSVTALIYYGQRAAGWREVVGALVRNPLILACLTGFLLNASGVGVPDLAGNTLGILGDASLTLGLLCVGAALDPARLGNDRRALAATAGLKLLLLPAATAFFCYLTGVEGLTAAAAILFTSVPISASSYVLARQLGGDAPLLAGMITITTIAAVVTMPLVLTLLT